MRTGISPFWGGGGGSGKMGFTALGKGWTILKMAVWFLSLEDFDLIISQTFAQISHFLEVEKSNYTSVTSVAMHEWNSVSFPVQLFFLSVKWHAHLTKIKMAYDLENVSCILHNYGHRNVLRFSNQCGNPHRKLQTIIFNWFWLHRDNYCWRGSEVEWRYVRGSDEDGER